MTRTNTSPEYHEPAQRHSLTVTVSSLRHVQRSDNLLCGWYSAAELLLCVISFFLGVMRFSCLSLPYIFLVDVKHMARVDATMVCHANMACMYLSEVLAGVVSKTRLGVPKTLVILFGSLFAISVAQLVWSVILDVRHGPVPLTVGTMLFVCLLLGGSIHCLRLITLNEFTLPDEYSQYLHVKFCTTECEYLGKAVGAFWVTGGYKPAPSSIISNALWIACSAILFIAAVVGAQIFKREKDSRNIIGDFLKHTFYALKANLLDKQNEEKFSADDMERIKIVHSATILYVPVIILIGLKDLKYSRYTWQSLQLTLNVLGTEMSPQKILIFYPLTVALFLPVSYFLINPYFKKKVASHKTRITTKAIVAFYFMAASLAFATILECRIEMGSGSQRQQNGTVFVFNFLPCNATIRVFCGTATNHQVNSMEVTKISCPQLKEEFDAKVVQGKCSIDGKKRAFSTPIVLIQSLDVMVAVGYDFHHNSNDNRTHPIYLQHLHYPHQQQGVGYKLFLVHNVMVNHTVAVVPVSLTKQRFWVPAGAAVYSKLLSSYDNTHIQAIDIEPGWYGIMLDDHITKILKYKNTKTYAILVAHDQHHVKVKTLLLNEKRTLSVLYQIPQICMSGLAEMVIESPGFIYGRKKIPIEWRDFALTIWTFSCFLGNSMIVVGTALLRGERNLLAFITGTAASIVSIALITIFLLEYFKADYEDAKRSE